MPKRVAALGYFGYMMGKKCVFLVLAVSLIFSSAAVFFIFVSHLNPNSVTLTTVGYGDLSAHSTSTKLFSCVYILVGVALIGALLSKLVEAVLDNQVS